MYALGMNPRRPNTQCFRILAVSGSWPGNPSNVVYGTMTVLHGLGRLPLPSLYTSSLYDNIKFPSTQKRPHTALKEPHLPLIGAHTTFDLGSLSKS